MIKIAFYDYRQPIEMVIEKYFQKQRLSELNTYEPDIVSLGISGGNDDILPEEPVRILRDEKGRAYKFIYGNIESLETDEECSPIIWQEELVRNEDGKVEKVILTYPDGEILEKLLIRDDNNKVWKVDI